MKIIILCGGRGIRAHPLTKNTPKALIKISKRPFLGYLTDYFYKRNFEGIILCTGFCGEDIKKWANDNCKFNFEISHNPKASIIQRIYGCKDMINEIFIVCYGDTLADVDLEALLEFHKSHNGIATITTYKYRMPFGTIEDIEEQNYLVKSFKEKRILPMRISIGYMVFDKDVFNYMSPKGTVQGFLNKLAKSKKLYSFRHEGRHYTFNTPDDVERISQKALEEICEVHDR